MSRQDHTAKRDSIQMVQNPIDRMRPSVRSNHLGGGNVPVHDHYRGSGHLLDQCIALAMIRVRVARQQDLDIREFEAELLH